MMRCLAIAAVLAWSPPVAADAPRDPQRATALFGEAEVHYQGGDFLTAAAKYKAAYDADPDPAYLFNVAQAYRFGNDCVQALDYYKKFLAIIPDPPNLARIKVWVQDSEVCAKVRLDEKARAEHRERERAERDRALREQAARREAARSPHVGQLDDRTGGDTARWLAIATGGIGVIALGVAAAYTVEKRSLDADRAAFLAGCSAETPCAGTAVIDFDRRADRASSIATASYVIGGSAIATAIAFYVISRRDRRVVLAPAPNGARVVAAFRF